MSDKIERRDFDLLKSRQIVLLPVLACGFCRSTGLRWLGSMPGRWAEACWPPSGWAQPLRPWVTRAGPGGIWEKGPGTPRSQTNAPSATSFRPTWLPTNPNLLTYCDTIPAWIFIKGPSLLVTHINESNKIAQKIRHYFPIQFLLLLQVMCSVLLSVLPIKTDSFRDVDWLLKYPTNQLKGYEKATQTEKRSTPPERALKATL